MPTLTSIVSRRIPWALAVSASLAVFTAAAEAQQGRITVRVTDAATQQPIAQAQVQIVGTTQGALTGADGRALIRGVVPQVQQVRVLRVGYAEQKKVNVVMELLNSKVNHKNYMCDKTPWGVELCKKVGSDRFKLLYDIYHMQIMEGDVIATIKKYQKYIAHYHTGGVPGRNEIDDTQELNYPAIMNTIVTGWT